MALILHRGAELVPYDHLCSVPTPEATASHVPLPHHHLVDMVRYALGFYKHEIIEEAHATTPDGLEYFGLLKLKSPHGDYVDTCGLRNSNSKRFPIGIAFGAAVMVCDNLSFHGTHVVRRKHTAGSKRDLPGLVAGIVEPLAAQREAQRIKIDRYRATDVTDQAADHVIMNLYREGVYGIQKVADIAEQWNTPAHDWGPKTAWRMFNCVTFGLTGKVAEQPHLTRRLHDILDQVCT